MKRLSFFEKLVFLVNSGFAFLLIFGLLLPYMPPHIFPALSVIALGLPVLIIINIIFFIYWLIRLKRPMLLSGLILVLGFGQVKNLYVFNSDSRTEEAPFISVMSYNVRLFGKEGWAKNPVVGDKVVTFIEAESADVVCLQEYRGTHEMSTKTYPHRYEVMKSKNRLGGQKIYSKYPIINKGNLEFDSRFNNAIYTDIVKDQDTIRIYNVHFESLRLAPQVSELQKENSKRLLGRLGQAFKKQEAQAAIFLAHQAQSPYPVFVAGDFNNRSSSYLYKTIKGDKEDAFLEAGFGIGATFNFDFLPIRIDFILNDAQFKPVSFKNYDVDYSDHYPIKATFSK